MPKYLIEGSIHLSTGFAETVTADNIVKAEREVKKRLESMDDEYVIQHYGASVEEICVQSSSVVPESETAPPASPNPAPAGTRIPRVGDRVRLAIGGCGNAYHNNCEFIEVPAGEIWEISRIDYFRRDSIQSLAFTLEHSSGVVNVIDEANLIDGYYPFEVV